MDESKIETIYQIIINKKPITKIELIKQGFNEFEINQIIEEGILKPIDNNEYKLYSLYELYYYGLNLLSKNQAYQANACFKRCYELEPNNRDFALQQFLRLHYKDFEVNGFLLLQYQHYAQEIKCVLYLQEQL